MKKRVIVLALAAVSVLVASCTKDDLELLKHPYRVQGELHPSYGLPIISNGQLNLNDLLTSFDGTFSGIITDDNTITFHYDTSIRETIVIGGMIGRQPARKGRVRGTVRPQPKMSNPPFIQRDTVIEYSLPIDFFDKADMQSIVEGGISIHELRFSLSAYVQGGCPANVEEALRNYVRARFDEVTIKYQGHDYQTHTFTGFMDQSLALDDIIAGGSVTFDSVNLAEIVNSMPRMITAGFRMHIEVDSALVLDNLGFDTASINSFQTLLDSLKMTYLTIGGDLDVTLPFEVSIDGLGYNYDLAFSDGNSSSSNTSGSVLDVLDSVLNKLLGEGAVNMDSSKVTAIVILQNGIPLNLTLDGTFIDENGAPTLTLLEQQLVASAITAPVANRPGVSEAVADSTTRVEIPLTIEALDKMIHSSALRLTLRMATTDSDYKVVKRDDYLKVKLLVKLDPSLGIDMELFDPSGLPLVGDILDRIGN